MLLLSLFLAFQLSGCAKTAPNYRAEEQGQAFLDRHTAGAVNADAFVDADKKAKAPAVLPDRFQQPTFLLSETEDIRDDELTIPVGADISSHAEPVALREIMKKLAVLKGMNVSWASDVDQGALVDVDIRAEDDFFDSIDNILRQLDYFYEVQGNSIIVKYRDTRTFHVAMPFMSPQFSLGVGGDVLGGNQQASHEMSGKIQITSAPGSESSFDVWANIASNLDKILQIYEETEIVETVTEKSDTNAAAAQPQKDKGAAAAEPPVAATRTKRVNQGAFGYYVIDKPVGLVSVTAPRSLLDKVGAYIDNLKKELYRQVSIEAKIVEVTLSADNRTGINWEDLLQNSSNPFNFNMDFQKLNPYFHSSGTQNKFLTLRTQNFNLVLDAIEEQGHVEVISNPKISVMNGQPAMISVGESMTYIESVEATIDEGIITYSVETSNVMSGLGMAVIATIINEDEVILTLTPVTSEVKTPIEYRQFGSAGSEVGLPEVAIREMTTLVRIRNGEMLIVGGLIDSVSDYGESQIPHLGDIPVAGKLFGASGANKERKELVILLRPVVL